MNDVSSIMIYQNTPSNIFLECLADSIFNRHESVLGLTFKSLPIMDLVLSEILRPMFKNPAGFFISDKKEDCIVRIDYTKLTEDLNFTRCALYEWKKYLYTVVEWLKVYTFQNMQVRFVHRDTGFIRSYTIRPRSLELVVPYDTMSLLISSNCPPPLKLPHLIYRYPTSQHPREYFALRRIFLELRLLTAKHNGSVHTQTINLPLFLKMTQLKSWDIYRVSCNCKHKYLNYWLEREIKLPLERLGLVSIDFLDYDQKAPPSRVRFTVNNPEFTSTHDATVLIGKPHVDRLPFISNKIERGILK